MSTKPKMSQLQPSYDATKAYERQRKKEKFAQQIEHGGFYDSSDDEDGDSLDEVEDVFGHTDSHEWWMSDVEDSPKEKDWEIHRVPSLEFDPPTRVSSISTNTTFMTDEVCPSTPTPSEIAHYRQITELAMLGGPYRRHSRRRTASSECLVMDAAEGLRTMYIEDTPDECAVEDEENSFYTEKSQKTNTISSKSPSDAGTFGYQATRPLAVPPTTQRVIK